MSQSRQKQQHHHQQQNKTKQKNMLQYRQQQQQTKNKKKNMLQSRYRAWFPIRRSVKKFLFHRFSAYSTIPFAVDDACWLLADDGDIDADDLNALDGNSIVMVAVAAELPAGEEFMAEEEFGAKEELVAKKNLSY